MLVVHFQQLVSNKAERNQGSLYTPSSIVGSQFQLGDVALDYNGIVETQHQHYGMQRHYAVPDHRILWLSLPWGWFIVAVKSEIRVNRRNRTIKHG